MKWRLALLTLAATLPASQAVENAYQSGKIVSVRQMERTRVLYYLVNTPVTQDDPHYEVVVRLQDTLYTTEYTPRHREDTLPDDWTADADVQARLSKRRLFVKRPNGYEIELVIVKRSSVGRGKTAEPAPK